MKKKIVITAIAMALAMSLLACGSSEDNEDTNNQEIQQESEQNDEEIMAELAGKLQLQAAWQAVVSYGAAQYDAFEVRYMPGQPVETTAEDANTWLLKAECFVDGESKNCEAKVTGTTEAPEVISFNVY